MLQLHNRTPYSVERAILLNEDGEEFWVVVVKATYSIVNGRAVLAEDQVPVTLADEYVGEPGISSLKYESEMILEKKDIDILLNGHAYSPSGRPVRSLEVAMRVGTINKRIMVYGDRVWKWRPLSATPSRPRPFTRMPLVYERAYGGVDPMDQEGNYDIRNPIGLGYAKSKRHLRGTIVPNLVDPKHPLAKSGTLPIGFGAVAKSWQPRLSWAGTYDEQWQQNRMPLWPKDLDVRFFQSAPLDQVISRSVKQPLVIELKNLTPTGILKFEVPRVALGFETLLGNELVPHRGMLDTILVEPDESRVLLTWRTSISCHRRKLDLQWTRVFEKEQIK